MTIRDKCVEVLECVFSSSSIFTYIPQCLKVIVVYVLQFSI